MKHRVAITGMGVVSPIGSELDELRDNLLAGVSGVAPITLFDAASFRTRIAAEVKEHSGAGFRDRKIAFACESAWSAVAEAACCGTQPGKGDGAAAGLSLGLGLELFSMDDLAAMRRPGFTPP